MYANFCCNPPIDSANSRIFFSFVFFKDMYIWSLKAKIYEFKKKIKSKDLCYKVQDLERLEQMLLFYIPWKMGGIRNRI